MSRYQRKPAALPVDRGWCLNKTIPWIYIIGDMTTAHAGDTACFSTIGRSWSWGFTEALIRNWTFFKVSYISCQYWVLIYCGPQSFHNLTAKTGFLHLSLQLCVPLSFYVCVCVSVHVHIQKPNLPSVWPKSKNKKEKKIFRVETFFCVTQMAQMKMRWHKPSIKFCSLTFSEFCIAKPAISPANGVACWCVDVAITGNRRDHCTKACTSFPSPRIRADQHETSSSALSASAWGREKKMRSLLGNFLK